MSDPETRLNELNLRHHGPEAAALVVVAETTHRAMDDWISFINTPLFGLNHEDKVKAIVDLSGTIKNDQPREGQRDPRRPPCYRERTRETQQQQRGLPQQHRLADWQ